ncbi:hypothetical protein BpHYR1_011027 [Brachionus plicatilis]|uniref:Uncharacterized protein n=1 Tax=Brachionus plicatilis TaxID=10195 RepID=A0A3M7QAS3_BRAPC|nr:hypothetical protein BpHYR1_011027 [Brachionus plicatilis]
MGISFLLVFEFDADELLVLTRSRYSFCSSRNLDTGDSSLVFAALEELMESLRELRPDSVQKNLKILTIFNYFTGFAYTFRNEGSFYLLVLSG